MLQTLEEELAKMDPAELLALEEEIAKEIASAQMEEIQQLTPERKRFFSQKSGARIGGVKTDI